jgi:hypothetical protein
MNRRGFLKSFGGMVGVGVGLAIIPKIVLSAIKEESILVPYKNKIKMEAGYFYCPYIPLMTTSPYNDFKVNFKTRYN